MEERKFCFIHHKLDKADLGSVQENRPVGSKTHGEGTGDLKVSHFNKLAQHLSEMAQRSGGPTLRRGVGQVICQELFQITLTVGLHRTLARTEDIQCRYPSIDDIHSIHPTQWRPLDNEALGVG